MSPSSPSTRRYLAAGVAYGVMGHPMWSLDWAVERVPPELQRGLERGGRRREATEVNLWLWVAPNPDESEAIEDARATVAFYAGMKQYESKAAYYTGTSAETFYAG